MGKRDWVEKIFIVVCGLVLISAFIPCVRVNVSYEGIVSTRIHAILDANTGFMHILLPVATAFLIIIGKRILATVAAFITIFFNGFVLLYYLDAGDNLAGWYEDNTGLMGQMMRSVGIDSVTVELPVGFYLVVTGLALLLIMAIVNIVIKED